MTATSNPAMPVRVVGGLVASGIEGVRRGGRSGMSSDVGARRGQALDAFGVDVEPDDVVADLDGAHGERQPDVPLADDDEPGRPAVLAHPLTPGSRLTPGLVRSWRRTCRSRPAPAARGRPRRPRRSPPTPSSARTGPGSVVRSSARPFSVASGETDCGAATLKSSFLTASASRRSVAWRSSKRSAAKSSAGAVMGISWLM